MSWIKNTGSPSTGHPFSSLNPEAVVFVPRQDNTASAEELPRPTIPPPFSQPESTVEDTNPYYEDKTVVANSFSEHTLPHQPHITEQPVTTNVYQDYHADKPESICTEENSTNQNDIENCQTVEEVPIEESPNDDEIAPSDEHIPSPLEEQPHRPSEPYSDQNIRNRDSFRGRGHSGYSNRGGRGSFRGRGKYFKGNQYQRSESRWPHDNTVHQSSDKPEMNQDSSYERHARERRESSSRTEWDTQGPRQQDQDWREKRSRDNEQENRRRQFSNDKYNREKNSAERGWNNSQDTRETVDNRGRRRGTNPRSRGGNEWRGPKFDKPRYGGRQDRRNASNSEDEFRMSHDDSSWDNYHITDDDSSNAWDQDEKSNNVDLKNIEDSNSSLDVDLERFQSSSVANTLEKQDTGDTKEVFKPSKFNNKLRTRPYYDKTNQKQDRRFSDFRRSFDEDLPEGTNLMDELISKEISRRAQSKTGEESSNEQHENLERRQGSSGTRGMGRGRSNSGPRRDEQKWREKRNKDDQPYRNNERQNRQRTFSNDKREREYDSNNSRGQRQPMDGRIGRRGTYTESRGSKWRGKYDGPEYEGRHDGFSPEENNQKDNNCPEDDLKITNDDSSSDNYHITDDDSNNAWDMPKIENVENSNSWNDEVDSERSQSTSVMNTLANEDSAETLHKSSEFNNKSGRSSQRPNKSVSKSRGSFDEGGDTDLPVGTNLMELPIRAKISPNTRSKNSSQNLNEKDRPRKHSEKPPDSGRSPDSVPSSAQTKKSFPEEKNNNVAERVKPSRQFTETPKLLDPRMEREKLNKSCASVVLEEERDRKKNNHSDDNSKQRRITSYFEPSGDRELWDKEFDLWEKRWQSIKEFKRVNEVEGDLFEQPKDYSLAHCVAEDLRMGSGIAVAFKREFKNLPELLDQRAKQGGLATLHDEANNRYVYYLVTKRESTGKPTYFTLWKSLYKMREHVKEHEVKKIAVPRLACGLDRLEWDKVKSMLETLFKDIDVEIRVCNFQQSEFTEEKKSKTCKLVVEDYPVTKIATGTLILYLATSDGKEDDIIVNLSKKFNFWPAFQVHKSKDLGNIVYYDDKVKNFGLCGCIVRRTSKEAISFKSLHMCIQNFNKMNKQFGSDKFEYVAFQWVDENAYNDDLINQKIITLLIGFLKNVDVYVCKGSFGDEGE